MKKLEEVLRWVRKRKLVAAAAGTLLLLSLVVLEEKGAFSTGGDNVQAEDPKIRVVVDAGHGGMDPGKVGINGANEKDINLEIAGYLRQYLEANDIEVVMTRENDEGLNDADASNKKVQDMKRRIELIDVTAPAITVSIHQNSYPEEYVHGAQVFYYTGSKEGQALAQSIQEELVAKLDPENKRQVKANDSYYLLKKTGIPIVIVECGFLSNSAEAEKLCTEAYQKRVAWAIHMGILRYLNTRQSIIPLQAAGY
ncbi:MAG: N-acetylmuramoyl-L-alanine amidase [Blautia sp.]|nr:N-acetylmuramoyl-L-alanine amidase [Blautia sp.]